MGSGRGSQCLSSELSSQGLGVLGWPSENPWQCLSGFLLELHITCHHRQEPQFYLAVSHPLLPPVAVARNLFHYNFVFYFLFLATPNSAQSCLLALPLGIITFGGIPGTQGGVGDRTWVICVLPDACKFCCSPSLFRL